MHNRVEQRLLKFHLADDITRCNDHTVLFREETLASSLFVLFCKIKSWPYIQTLLKPLLSAVSQTSWQIEVNPHLLPSPDQLSGNVIKLTQLCSSLLADLFASHDHISRFPSSLLDLLFSFFSIFSIFS